MDAHGEPQDVFHRPSERAVVVCVPAFHDFLHQHLGFDCIGALKPVRVEVVHGASKGPQRMRPVLLRPRVLLRPDPLDCVQRNLDAVDGTDAFWLIIHSRCSLDVYSNLKKKAFRLPILYRRLRPECRPMRKHIVHARCWSLPKNEVWISINDMP